jgi:GTP-binding protein HflX
MLVELGAAEKPTLLVFNKIDAYSYVQKDDDDLTPITRENFSLDDLKNSWMAKENSPCIFISALKKENVQELRKMLLDEIKKIHHVRYPNQPQG